MDVWPPATPHPRWMKTNRPFHPESEETLQKEKNAEHRRQGRMLRSLFLEG